LCGPGAISTVIVLQTQAETLAFNAVLLASVPVVYLACYVVLRVSVSGAAWLNPMVLRILRRLMGLLFAVIAVQFIINGVGQLPFVVQR
jgi:multiple antibiotic resistance protein